MKRSSLFFVGIAAIGMLFQPLLVVEAQTTTATSSPEAASSTASTTPPVTPPPPPTPTPPPTIILEERTQTRIINLAANISNRFDAIILRLENISGRLSKRATKLAERGHNISAATQSLDTARAALSSAKTEMQDIDIAVHTAVGSQDPKAEWQTVRAKYFRARESIKAAHATLKGTVVDLKNAPLQAAPAATSTDA